MSSQQDEYSMLQGFADNATISLLRGTIENYKSSMNASWDATNTKTDPDSGVGPLQQTATQGNLNVAAGGEGKLGCVAKDKVDIVVEARPHRITDLSVASLGATDTAPLDDILSDIGNKFERLETVTKLLEVQQRNAHKALTACQPLSKRVGQLEKHTSVILEIVSARRGSGLLDPCSMESTLESLQSEINICMNAKMKVLLKDCMDD